MSILGTDAFSLLRERKFAPPWLRFCWLADSICMAQWTGQFGGFTHETKVQDTEVSLRQAIESYKASPGAKRDAKLKAIHSIAKRLRSARLKALRARLSALSEPGRGRLDGRQATHLRIRVAELEAQSVDQFLREFGFT